MSFCVGDEKGKENGKNDRKGTGIRIGIDAEPQMAVNWEGDLEFRAD